MKSYLHKDKRYEKKKKQKGVDRVQNISWFERYMTTHLVAAAQMNFVSMIFASRTLEVNLQLYRSPQTPSTRRYLFSYPKRIF